MHSTDLELLRLINREWTSPALDWMMPVVSNVSLWIPVFVLAAAIIAIRGGRRGWLMLASIAAAIGIGDVWIDQSLKHIVQRPRPRDAMEGVRVHELAHPKHGLERFFPASHVRHGKPGTHAQGNSFPSSHASNMFALATVIFMFHRRWGIAAAGIASLVAYSRIYCGSHWPSDMPPSALLGIAVGWLVANLITCLVKRLGWLREVGLPSFVWCKTMRQT